VEGRGEEGKREGKGREERKGEEGEVKGFVRPMSNCFLRACNVCDQTVKHLYIFLLCLILLALVICYVSVAVLTLFVCVCHALIKYIGLKFTYLLK